VKPVMHANTDQYVVFVIHDQFFSLAIQEVIEIIRPKTITCVAGVKPYIEGVINLRGKIIPIINLRSRFGIHPTALQKKNRILIVHGQDEEQIGLMVDEVRMVTSIADQQMEPAPDSYDTNEEQCFVCFAKVENDVIGILNLHQVLFPDMLEGGTEHVSL